MKNGNLESGIATQQEVSETDAKPTRANRTKRSSSEAKDAGEPEQGHDLPKGRHNSNRHRAHSEQSHLGCARALHRFSYVKSSRERGYRRQSGVAI